jgi:hypothetical protein
MSHHERCEQVIDFVRDYLALVLRDASDRHRGDAAMTIVWSYLNVAIEPCFRKRLEDT